MDLSIILVNWNSEAYLEQCIASIYDSTRDLAFEIIVVDNASPAGNVDALKDRYPDIRLVKSPENLGFARANNLGFKHSSGSFILILNPDTKIVGPAIQILLDNLNRLPDGGIIGGRLVNPDLTIQTTSIQKFPTILNQVADVEWLRLRWPSCRLWGIAPLFSEHPELVKVDVIPGACMLLRREVFERVGMFTEAYFMYAEDIDLNYKVARAGWNSYYVSNAIIIHYEGRSTAHRGVNQWATVMKFRAMCQYYRINHGPIYAGMYRATMGCAAMARIILIGILLPFGHILRKKDGLRFAAAKWGTILQWAMGVKR